MKILFWLYLIFLLLRPQEFISGFIGLPVLQILLLACLALWVAKPNKRLDLPQFKMLLILFILLPLTVGISGWWGGVIAAVGQLVPVMGMFIIASMASRELSALRLYMWTIIVCALLLVLHSHVQMQTGVGPVTGALPVEGRPYYVGIFNDPNDLGQLFLIALVFSMYLMAVYANLLIKLLLLTMIACLFYGMILTDSRGALIAALAAIALEGWRRYGKVAVGIGAGIAVPALFAATRLSQLNANEQSANDRIVAWYQGIQMVREHPLFGVGFGRFTEHHYLTAHNFIVLPMAELGVPGLILWMTMIWFAFRMLWWVGFGPHSRVPKNSPIPIEPRAASEIFAGRALFVTWVGFAISSFFLSQSYKASIFLLGGFALARFVAAGEVLPDPPRYRLLSDLPKVAVLSVGCMAVIYVLVMRTM